MPRWLLVIVQWMRTHPLGSMTVLGMLGALLYWQLRAPMASGAPPATTPDPAFAGAVPGDATTAKALAQMQREAETLAGVVATQQRALAHLDRVQRRQAEVLQTQRQEQAHQLDRALKHALQAAQHASPTPPPPPVVVAPPPPRMRILRPTRPPSVSRAPGRGAHAPTAHPSGADARWVRLPAGSFVTGRLLTGLFASTRSGGAMPVLLAVRRAYSGPNQRAIPLQGCLAIGKASADLPARRALMQLTTLSCVLPDGTSFERSVKGYVTGRDGTVGVPGRLETQSGAFLANVAAASMVAAGEEFAQTQRAGSRNVVTQVGGTALQRSTQRLVDFFLGWQTELK